MKIQKLLFSVLAILLLVTGTVFSPPAVHADPQDETAMSAVAKAVEDLWTFVDNSGDMKDEQFYPEFVARAQTAESQIDHEYDDLAKTQETGESRLAIQDILGNIRAIQGKLGSLRQAAVAQDGDAFESANIDLSDAVDTYDQAINVYNAAEYGQHTVTGIALRAGVPALAFTLSMILLALALIKDEKQEHDAAKEILRRLRWHQAYSALAILVGASIQAGLYFFANIEPSVWLWLAILPGLGALCFTTGRYAKVRFLARQSQ